MMFARRRLVALLHRVRAEYLSLRDDYDTLRRAYLELVADIHDLRRELAAAKSDMARLVAIDAAVAAARDQRGALH